MVSELLDCFLHIRQIAAPPLGQEDGLRLVVVLYEDALALLTLALAVAQIYYLHAFAAARIVVVTHLASFARGHLGLVVLLVRVLVANRGQGYALVKIIRILHKPLRLRLTLATLAATATS